MDYGKFQTLGSKLLDKFGTEVRITRANNTVMKTTGVLTNIEAQNADAQLAQTTYQGFKVIVKGDLPYPPTAGDTVTIKTKNYKVTNVITAQPAGLPIVYTLVVT